jgi:hypothetical protein
MRTSSIDIDLVETLKQIMLNVRCCQSSLFYQVEKVEKVEKKTFLFKREVFFFEMRTR